MLFAKQSTAASVIVGPILDAAGVEYTSAVIGDLSLSKNGGTLTALAAAATLTHIANGQYTLSLTTGNTDTLGRAQITCNKATYQMPTEALMVFPSSVYDALVTNAVNTTGGLAAATGNITALAGALSTLDAAGIRAAIGMASANLDSQLSSVQTAITNLTNLSALANLYGSPLLEIPDSSSTAFAFTLVVHDQEGKLVDLDASPTVTAANAAGTDRSGNLSAVSHPATGRYTFSYSVASNAVAESLRIVCNGAVSAEGRYVEWVGAVVNYDSLTTLQAVYNKVANLPDDPASEAAATANKNAVIAAVGTPLQDEDYTAPDNSTIGTIATAVANLSGRIPDVLVDGRIKADAVVNVGNLVEEIIEGINETGVTVNAFSAAALAQISARGIVVSSPSISTKRLKVYCGTVHSIAGGTAWTWIDAAGQFPAGGTWRIELFQNDVKAAEGTVSLISGDPGESQVYAGEMTAAATDALTTQTGSFFVIQQIDDEEFLRWYGVAEMVRGRRPT